MRKTSYLLLASLGVALAVALFILSQPLSPSGDLSLQVEQSQVSPIPAARANSPAPVTIHPSSPQVSFFDRPGLEPAWAVRYGREFWRLTSQIQRASNGPDISGAVERVRHAFGGDKDPLAVKGRTFAVELDKRGFKFSPFLPGKNPSQQPGVALRMETSSVTSGGQELYRATSAPINWSINGNIAQGLLSPENGLVEHYDVRNGGMSVTWLLNQKPVTAGDLEIRWKHEGLRLGATTASGHHFFDSNGKARVKVGAATAVDSHGQRIPLKTESRGNHLVINIPRSVIESAGYPLAIDPEISSEFELDAPVFTDDATDALGDLRVSSNGSRWAVIAADNTSIIGVIVEENGSPVVTKALPLYSGTPDPETPEICPNSNGSWLVTWVDDRTGVEQLYGAVFCSDGTIITEDNGFAISNDAGTKTNRKVASCGDEWLATWTETSQVIYCMVIGPSGTLELSEKKQVGDNINQTCALKGGTNGYYMAWRDDSAGGPFDIFGTFISVDGDATHTSGEAIATQGFAQPYVNLEWNGTSWLVVWADARNSNYDIFGRLISGTGVLGSEFTVCVATNDQDVPVLASNGDSFFASWADQRAGNTDTYGAIISSAGAVITADNGFVISDEAATQTPAFATAIGTSYFTAWTDLRNGNSDIYGAVISDAGVVQQTDGFAICDDAASANFPAGASIGTNTLVVWKDFRSSEDNYFGAIVEPDTTVTPADGVAVMGNANTEENVAMAAADDTWFIAWEDNRNSATTGIDLYGMMLDANGDPISTNGIVICDLADDQTVPAVDANGSNEFLIAWHTTDAGAPVIHGAVISAAGAVQQTDGFLVLDPSGADPIERIRVTGYTGANWLVWCNINGYLNGVIVRPNATRIAMVAPLSAIPTDDGAAAGSTEGWLLTFTDTDNDNIKALKFLGDGSSTELTLCSAAGAQFSPVVTFNGTNWVAAWADQRSGSAGDIFAATIALDGTITAADIPICDSLGAQLEPAITSHDDGAFIAWTDYRDTLDGEIYGTFLTTSGVLHNDGFNISGDMDQALSNPHVTSNDDFVLAAWEGGDSYYAARIFPDATVESLAVSSQEAEVTSFSFGRTSNRAVIGLHTTNNSGFEQWTSSSRAAAQTIGVGQSQTIDFDDVADQQFTATAIPLTATASSGLPVTFSVVSGPGSINGSNLTLTGIGTLVLQADQEGDATYDSAPPVQQTVIISKRSHSISFASIGTRNFSETPITLSASSNRGLGVSFRLLSGPARLSGNRLTMTGLGTVQVQAFNSGNSITLSASSTQSFRIIDNKEPKLTIGGAVRTGSSRVRLRGKVDDNHIVKEVLYRVRFAGEGFSKWKKSALSSKIGKKSFSISVSAPEVGEYVVELYPIDKSGNKGKVEKVTILRE